MRDNYYLQAFNCNYIKGTFFLADTEMDSIPAAPHGIGVQGLSCTGGFYLP